MTRPDGTIIIPTIKWALLLVIISILYLGLPSAGHGTEDPLTIEERVWLNQHSGKIVVNNEAGWPPIIDTDKDGNSFGIVMDYQRLLEKKLDFKFKLDKLDTWNNFMERFKKGKIDVNNNLQKTPERNEYALFTKPYIEIPNVIIVRKEIKGSMTLEKMRGMKIAVTRDFAIQNYLKKNYDYLQIVPFRTDLECLLETSTKSVDAAVVNMAVASFIIENSGIANLRVTGYAGYKNALCFASRKDLPILNQILEKGLILITQAERDAIFKKWISLGYEPFYKSRNFWMVSCSAAALIFTFAILILGWNRSLKRQVQLRTEKLKTINIQLKDEIEERKQAEEALRESEGKYKSLANNINVGIFRNTEGYEGEFLEANPAIVKMFGFNSREEFLKLRVIDLYKNSHDRKKYNEKLLKEGAVKNEELELRKKDGTSFIGSISAVVVKNEENQVKYYDGIIEDITERKRTEEKLRKSEERYREYFEENISGSYISSTEGQLIACNKEYERIFGFNSTQEALETPIDKFSVNPNQRVEFLQLLKKGKRVTGYKPILKKIDGTPIHLIENASGVFNDNGDLKHIRGFLLDVTEQRKLEFQLQQSQKMESIGTLAGGIAHDFNNILFPIMGHTELLLMDTPEDSPSIGNLKAINTAALRAKDLVKQILTFSRQESNELMLMKMQPIVKEALKLIRSTIPTTIEIKQDINPDCGIIKADPTQIHQIVMNLSTNAYHAMEETGGELKVSLKQVELGEYDIITPDMTPGVYACLTVSDTGVGMDKNLTQKIFDPFFTTKAVGKGTGMGLSVVHGIVTAMGGAINVYSEPEKGTKFNVYFPIEKNSYEKQIAQTNSTIPIQTGTENILFVDDEELILQMEKQMLERLGYQVTSRTSSLEALEAFRKNPDKFDMVITDMAMPNMSGDKLSVELTKIRPDIPVLLCTGFSETISEEKAASLGIKGFLLKPIVMSDLSQKIREVLDK